MNLPADDSTPSHATSPVIDVFPVAIGHFDDPGLPELDVSRQVGRVNELLALFGGKERRWGAPEKERDADAVLHRLEEWATAGRCQVDGSVLYWVGHGRSDGKLAALAHAGSKAQVGASGLSPGQLAYFIRRRHAQPGWRSWTLVVIDTCRSRQFVDLLADILRDEDEPPVNNVILLGVSGEGGATLGRFTDSLRTALKATYHANQRIRLTDLMAQLTDLLHGARAVVLDADQAELVRIRQPVASWMTAPYDTIRYLEEALEDLNPDERSHFMTKAQAAEYGELSWFFEGRAAEMAEIVGWLRTARSGMLVACGRAGSGKSALLGNVMVQSIPHLRDALARRGLANALDPGERPPGHVFDAVIHLSGLTMPQIIARIATAAGFAPQPSHTNPALGIATDLDWLADRLTEVTGPEAAARRRPFTVLCDALDESTDPLDTGRSLLARIAAIDGVRVVVGTRDSTTEILDQPPADINILEALATAPPPPGPAAGGIGQGAAAAADGKLVRVIRDVGAIRDYVRRRLLAAKSYGSRGESVPGMARVTDQDIDRVADVIADRDREFLYARLAVFELIADARLLTPERFDSLGELLEGDHWDLFGRALGRLRQENDRYPILLQALALARGRGVPEADSIWARIAAAVNPSRRLSDADGDKRSAWAKAIDRLRDDAAAYIIIDTPTADAPSTGSTDPSRGHQAGGASSGGGEDGTEAERGTVFRLAHRTFVDYFSTREQYAESVEDDRVKAATALLGMAAQAAGADPASLPTYLVRHLSGHIADAHLWDTLASDPGVLDCLDPDAVTADALRTLFGQRDIPPAVAGVIGARDALLIAPPADRAGLRQMATATHSAQQVIDEPTASWGVSAAHARSVTPHVRLSGHTASLNSVRSLNLPGRGTILASASDDKTIRLWDPATATPIGSPMRGHTSTVEDLAVYQHPSKRVMLTSAGGEGVIRRWDVYTGHQVGEPMTGHRGRIFGICTIPRDGAGHEERLATAGTDGTVRIWNPVTGEPVGQPLIGHQSWVWAVCPLPADPADAAAGTLLASCGADRTVRIWNLDSGQQIGEPLYGNTSTVFCVCALHSGGRVLLASAGGDGTVWIWDPVTREPVIEPITGYPGSLLTICELNGYASDGRAMLATTGYDGTVVVWDPDTGKPEGYSLSSDAGPAWGICTLPSQQPGGPELIATTGSDGTVRVWDPTAGQQTGQRVMHYTASARRVTMLPGRNADEPPLIITSAFHGRPRVWDPVAGRAVDHPLAENVEDATALCMVPGSLGHMLLAGTGEDWKVHLWDPATGQEVGPPLGESLRVAWAGCALEYHERPTRLPLSALLVIAGMDPVVEVWDPASGHLAGQFGIDHYQGVIGVCTLPGYAPDGRPNGRIFVATAGNDMMIRIWDPVTGEPVGPPLVGHDNDIQDICAFRWDGHTLLATVGFDGTLRRWDPVTGRQLGESLTGHTASVLGVSPLPGTEPTAPTLLITTGYDRTVRIWDPVAGEEVCDPLTGHTGRVWSACPLPGLSPLGEPGRYPLIASTGDDGTVLIWDPNTGRAVGEPLTESPDTVRAIVGPGDSAADCLLVSGDGSVQSWHATTATLAPVPAPRRVTAVGWSAGSGRTTLLTGDARGLVHLTAPGGNLPLRPPVRVDDGPVLALCPLDGLSAVAAAGRGGDVVLVPLRHETGTTGDPGLRRLPGHRGPVRDLCVVRPGADPLLASAGDDGTIRIWDARTGLAQGGPLTGHDGPVWSLAVVPRQGPGLASAGADKLVRLWDPLSGRQVTDPLTGHRDQVRAVTCATTADGRALLVSGSFDGTIRLWDCATGGAVHAIPVGVPVHALRQQQPDPRSRERTGDGATLTVGLRTGILVLDLHASLFPGRSTSP